MRHKTVCKLLLLFGLVGGILAASLSEPVKAQEASPAVVGTTFTYTGQLADNEGDPVGGVYDFEFKLYDLFTGGIQIGPVVIKDNVIVQNGLYTVDLDFGTRIFQGDLRYLEIAVRPSTRIDDYTPLKTRQLLAIAPYALALPHLWTEPTSTSPNLIGGYRDNNITPGAVGATIAGGGAQSNANRVTDDYGVVSGGHNNQAGDNAGLTSDSSFATVSGGLANNAFNAYSTVSGGWLNSASGPFATVGGGSQNEAGNIYATIGGGLDNSANGVGAAVGGGWLNNAKNIYTAIAGGYSNKTDEIYAAIGGGSYNTAGGSWSVVGGGYNNYASGAYSIIPGGRGNRAGGDFSFAAGQRAKAHSPGCFVWADASNTDLDCRDPNRFMVRAGGGVYFFSSADLNSGAALPPGSGSWATWSDRQGKTNFAPVDGQEILTRLSTLPIQTWNYKMQDPSIRHMGPTAQDFQAAFGLGEDERHINTVDADGVALAALQEMHRLVQEQTRRIAAQQEQIAALETRLAALEAALKQR